MRISTSFGRSSKYDRATFCHIVYVCTALSQRITSDLIFFLSEHEAVQLHESLSKIGTFNVIYRMEEVTSSQIDRLANTSFHDAPDIITFVVLCRWEISQQFLKQVFDFTIL